MCQPFWVKSHILPAWAPAHLHSDLWPKITYKRLTQSHNTSPTRKVDNAVQWSPECPGRFNYTFCPPKQFLMLRIISCPSGCLQARLYSAGDHFLELFSFNWSKASYTQEEQTFIIWGFNNTDSLFINSSKRELAAQVEMKRFILNSGMETSMYKP